MALDARDRQILEEIKARNNSTLSTLNRVIYKGKAKIDRLWDAGLKFLLKNKEEPVAESVYRGFLKGKLDRELGKKVYYPLPIKETKGYALGQNKLLTRYLFNTAEPSLKDFEFMLRSPETFLKSIKTRNMIGGIGIGATLGAVLGRGVSNENREKGALLGTIAGAGSGSLLAYLLNKGTEKQFRKALKYFV